jgi:flagellar basal body-associated protein FliL
MKKKWLVLGFAILAIIIAVISILFLNFRQDVDAANTRISEWTDGQVILLNAWPESSSVQMGDAFTYIVEVIYDSAEVSGIDEDALAQSIDFSPFTVRDVSVIEYEDDSGLHVYQRQYTLQLLEAGTNSYYEFSTIVVRYQLVSMDGYVEASVIPETLFVAPRIQNAVVLQSLLSGNDISINQTLGEIDNSSGEYYLWIIWILSGLLFVVGIVDLTWRVLPEWKAEKELRKNRTNDSVKLAYDSLTNNITNNADPEAVCYQMDLLVRVILAEKEGIDWLSEPDVENLSPEIIESVKNVFETCVAAYDTDNITNDRVGNALKNVEAILYYYYADERAWWKS